MRWSEIDNMRRIQVAAIRFEITAYKFRINVQRPSLQSNDVLRCLAERNRPVARGAGPEDYELHHSVA